MSGSSWDSMGGRPGFGAYGSREYKKRQPRGERQVSNGNTTATDANASNFDMQTEANNPPNATPLITSSGLVLALPLVSGKSTTEIVEKPAKKPKKNKSSKSNSSNNNNSTTAKNNSNSLSTLSDTNISSLGLLKPPRKPTSSQKPKTPILTASFGQIDCAMARDANKNNSTMQIDANNKSSHAPSVLLVPGTMEIDKSWPILKIKILVRKTFQKIVHCVLSFSNYSFPILYLNNS